MHIAVVNKTDKEKSKKLFMIQQVEYDMTYRM